MVLVTAHWFPKETRGFCLTKLLKRHNIPLMSNLSSMFIKSSSLMNKGTLLLKNSSNSCSLNLTNDVVKLLSHRPNTIW